MERGGILSEAPVSFRAPPVRCSCRQALCQACAPGAALDRTSLSPKTRQRGCPTPSPTSISIALDGTFSSWKSPAVFQK